MRIALAAVLVVLAGVAAWWFLLRSDPRDGIEQAAQAYLAAWQQQRLDDLADLTDSGQAPADAAQQMVEALGVTDLAVTAGEPEVVEQDGTTSGVVPFEATVTATGAAPFTYAGEVAVVREEERGWVVAWDPSTLHPDLRPGARFDRTREWAPRAPILGVDGAPLTGPTPVVRIFVVGPRVTDPDQVVDVLVEHTDASEEQVRGALDRAEERPDQRVLVTSLPRAAYDAVRDAVRPVPGLVFDEVEEHGRLPGAPAHIVGRVGEVTAEGLEELGTPYRVGDTVGRSGLERAFEQQLAGTPSGQLRIVDDAGEVTAVLAEVEGTPPEPLRTTLDPTLQQALEAAVADVDAPVGSVVLDARTAEVRAAVSRPLEEFDRALAGTYAPGSTFKVVTTSALLDTGLEPSSTVACPADVTVDGYTIGNAGDLALGDVPLRTAFARSCNTTFVALGADLPEGALQAAAERFGFNTDYPGFPLPVNGGSFPAPESETEAAAAAIGQGRVTVSPLHMASVAAATAAGAWQAPSLLADGSTDADGTEAPGAPIDAAATLRDLMREVVTAGTGTAADVAGLEVRGKTGTAEYGTGDPPPTHAWFIGTADDLAFAVLVEGGAGGGSDAAPVAARFLERLAG